MEESLRISSAGKTPLPPIQPKSEDGQEEAKKDPREGSTDAGTVHPQLELEAATSVECQTEWSWLEDWKQIEKVRHQNDQLQLVSAKWDRGVSMFSDSELTLSSDNEAPPDIEESKTPKLGKHGTKSEVKLGLPAALQYKALKDEDDPLGIDENEFLMDDGASSRGSQTSRTRRNRSGHSKRSRSSKLTSASSLSSVLTTSRGKSARKQSISSSDDESLPPEEPEEDAQTTKPPAEEATEPDSVAQAVAEEAQTSTEGIVTGPCQFCGQPLKGIPTLVDQQMVPPEELFCCEEYRIFLNELLTMEMQPEGKGVPLIDVKPHKHFGTSRARLQAREKTMEKLQDRKVQRYQAIAKTGAAPAFNQSFVGSDVDSRQMKTINYQLSSQKFFDQGWTVLSSTPIMDDKGDEAPVELLQIDPEEFRLQQRPLLARNYENGESFTIMFSDGTGNVLYPSGRVAICISSVDTGHYIYTLMNDADHQDVMAQFDAHGRGSCYYPNGNLRLYFDSQGGCEHYPHGGKKRRWNWKDYSTPKNAPPFQPIIFALTRELGVRVVSQEHIYVSFMANRKSCRFNVGSKIMAPKSRLLPQLASPRKEDDSAAHYLQTAKQRMNAIVKNMNIILQSTVNSSEEMLEVMEALVVVR